MSTTSQPSGTKIYLRLLGYMKPDIHLLIIGFIGFLIFAACDSAFAWWMKELVDSIQSQQSDHRWFLAGIIITIFIFRGIGGVGGGYCTEFVARRVVNKLRGEMFSHILKLPSNFYEKYSSGSVLAKLIFNIENIASASTNALRILVRGGFTVIGLLIFMFLTNWRLSSLFLIVTPIMAVIIILVTKRLRKLSQMIQSAMGNVSERAADVLKGFEVVKIFDGYDHENTEFSKVIENDRKKRLRLVLLNDSTSMSVQLIFSLALSAVIVIAMQPQMLQSMSAGEFVSFVTAAGFISRPILQLTQVNSVIQQGVAAAGSIFSVLDIDEEKDQGEISLKNCQGNIEFRNVGFRYINQENANRDWVINDVNLEIPAGSTCALVGRSGSGKTTLARLVARFYDPEQGCIVIDGIELPKISIASLRQHIALVNQNISLFNASVSENIAYGAMRGFERSKVMEAAELAQVMEFASKLPQGLDTQIGESGVMLSGGQRQRIAIARAFLKDSPILILDEATSALDNNSERLIQAAIQDLMSNRTSLIIAHRLSTIENADKIIVLEDGRIAESGNHQSLLALNGLYSTMHQQGNV